MVGLRLALVCLLSSLPLLTAWRSGTQAGPLGLDTSQAPSEIGVHRAVTDAPLEPEVLEMLQPDSYVMRLYRSEAAPEVWLYLASYSGLGTTGAHDPAVCYPANGWDLQGLSDREVALPGGEALTAKLLLAAQSGKEELVLYWFQPVDRWTRPAPAEQLLRAYDGFAGRPQYVFVRLSTPIDDDRPRSEQVLIDFARDLAPWLRTAMSQTP